jgi:AraC-like DNA-binding protein
MGLSTLASWALLIARALAEKGLDAEPLFHRAGLSTKQLRDANARYPVEAMQRLWVASVAASGDPCFGLEVGRRWHPTTFHALGYAAMASSTLREALAYVSRYCRTVSTGATLGMEDRGTEVDLVLDSTAAAPVADETALRMVAQAGLAAMATLCRVARGEPLAIRRVAFAHTDEGCKVRLEEYFGCAVVFGAGHDAITFAQGDLDAPLASHNADLLRVNHGLVVDRFASLESAPLSMQVRAQIARLLPSGEVDQEAVASALRLSRRSMQRKLRPEGVSFRRLLDDTRREHAQEYLQDETLSSAEVAYLLGFSETSSLSRALRRWKSPGIAAGA